MYYLLFTFSLCVCVSSFRENFCRSLDLDFLLACHLSSVGLETCASSGAGNCCIRCLLVETVENNIAYMYFDRGVLDTLASVLFLTASRGLVLCHV